MQIYNVPPTCHELLLQIQKEQQTLVTANYRLYDEGESFQ
jgi:hypothetical protein